MNINLTVQALLPHYSRQVESGICCCEIRAYMVCCNRPSSFNDRINEKEVKFPAVRKKVVYCAADSILGETRCVVVDIFEFCETKSLAKIDACGSPVCFPYFTGCQDNGILLKENIGEGWR